MVNLTFTTNQLLALHHSTKTNKSRTLNETAPSQCAPSTMMVFQNSMGTQTWPIHSFFIFLPFRSRPNASISVYHAHLHMCKQIGIAHRHMKCASSVRWPMVACINYYAPSYLSSVSRGCAPMAMPSLDCTPSHSAQNNQLISFIMSLWQTVKQRQAESLKKMHCSNIMRSSSRSSNEKELCSHRVRSICF